MWRARLGVGAVLLLGFALVPALTSANAVPASRVDALAQGIGASALKPAACAALGVTATVIGPTGGNASELILGSAGTDTMRGNSRDDCMLGGGGNDSLRGDAGTDVCVGGPGVDTFHASCETQIQ